MRGGDYLLAVKANQPRLYGELDTPFAQQDETLAGVEIPVQTAHGRNEQRLGWVPWQVENQLHWVLDVAFNEDRSRARRAHSTANLVVLRHWAFNLLKQDTSIRLGIKNKRNKAGWDMDYLRHLLSLAQTA